MEIKIIRNAPPPPARETRGRKKGGGSKQTRPRMSYPWADLRVGDAFDVPLPATGWDGSMRHPVYNAVTATVSARNRDGPYRYVVRLMDDYRVRVWRLQ